MIQHYEQVTQNVSEGGLLLLLPRALHQRVPLTVGPDPPTGPAARSGRFVWTGKLEPTELGGIVIPYQIAFGEPQVAGGPALA